METKNANLTRARSGRMTVWGVAVLLLGATLAWADGEAASTVSAGAADPAELRAVVVDDQLSEADRRQAAAALLAHEGEPARGLVLQLLAEPTAARLWRPLVIAMGQASTEPAPELVEPLVALLGAVEPAVQADLAAALGRYEDTQLVERLSAIAASERHELAARHGAALALGHQRSQAAAAVLIELIADDQPEAVRTPAFAALAVLTGREELGHDRAAWQAWWTSASELNEKQWHAHLLANFAEQTRLAREQHSRVEGRLVDAHRTLYRNAAGDEREARLIRLLEDPMPALRRLGLEMAVQRLVNDRAFEEPVREALRNRLDDPESAIRQRATLLLRDLADAPAADRVAHRLAEKREQSEPVLRANLLLMSRLPRIEAVERSLELLSHPTLRGEAAGALAASVVAARLTYQQGARAL
ncbi:MAG: HEAT repeat domain-containing protein, partial [Phycisphaeraceae bacterium]